MSDQTNGPNLDKTIKPNDLTNVTLVPKDDKKILSHSIILSTSRSTTNKEEGNGFPCDKCEKVFPNHKKAKDLHMQRDHNIKILKATPGPIRRSTSRLPIKCGVCSFTCKSGPIMKKHTERLHNNDTAQEQQKEKKRPRNSYTCPTCNSTFVSNFLRNKHVKEQHEGKNMLSPERKIARTDFENKQEVDEINKDMVTIPKKELKNLHDLLRQTGKDKEDLSKRIAEVNKTIFKTEKENCRLEQETKYLKSDNEKVNEDLNKLDSVYKEQVTDLKKTVEQKDIEIKIVKDQLEKHTKVKLVAEVEQEVVTIKCRECDFRGRTQNELDEHHRNECSEAFIQQLLEEDNGFVCQRCGMDFSGRTQNEWEQHQQNNCSGLVCPICGVTRNTQNNMEIHMEYHDNDEQDTDWSNEEDTQVEEVQVAGGEPEEEQEVTGESEEAWNRVQRTGSRYKCQTCGITRNTKNKIDRHMREHEEDIDECIHSMYKCDKCSDQSNTGNQIEKPQTNIHESNTIICTKCNLSCFGKNKLITHIRDKHQSYKPCIKFGAGHCDTVDCRFRHIKLSGNREICYKCGHISQSKTENITHIKSKHGNEICYKFIQNQCGRSSENCLFTHQTAPNVRPSPTPPTHVQQDFREGPTPQLHSPRVAVPTMSEHIQNQQVSQSPPAQGPQQVNIMNMIPQIVAQVVAALTMHLN